MPFLLLISILVIAVCGLIYELVAGTLASYLLGDSVTQFSTIIGVYLFSMGIGSYLSKFFNKNLIGWFIQVEIILGLVGGVSSSLLFVLFEQVESFRVLLYFLVVVTGSLVGLEIPLIIRILKDQLEFKDLISKVFTFDYIGALLASIVFPLILVPYLGLIKTSFFFGIMNVVIALIFLSKFKTEIKWGRHLRAEGIIVMFALVAGFIFSEKIQAFSEGLLFKEPIVFSKSSSYQRIVLTKTSKDLRLYLNGNLQFSSLDEYRYHEALVHPGLHKTEEPKEVLVLGGGDGLAVREILKHGNINKITLVDLDEEMTKLFATHPSLTSLNKGALKDKKVRIIHDDAFQWLKQAKEKFDFIVVDFPDPSNYSIGKLYSLSFYEVLKNHLTSSGTAVIQSTSPFAAPESFWCINNTIRKSGLETLPYHVYVPSFGEWGFILAGHDQVKINTASFPQEVRFINKETVVQSTVFPKDMIRHTAEVNRLNNQSLVKLFEEEWSNYLQ